MMKMKYTVTFEFEHALPIVKRGTVTGSTYRTCAARAVETLVTDHIPSSIVVLLERI